MKVSASLSNFAEAQRCTSGPKGDIINGGENMGKFYYDENGYPRWRNSGLLVHRTVSRPRRNQIVHHIDGDKGNFRRGNLVNMDRSEHSKLHSRERRSFWW